MLAWTAQTPACHDIYHHTTPFREEETPPPEESPSLLLPLLCLLVLLYVLEYLYQRVSRIQPGSTRTRRCGVRNGSKNGLIL